MWTDLLQIKCRRRDSAARVTREKAATLEVAKKAVRAVEAELDRHRTFVAAEESRLFGEIRGKAVTMERIDELKFDLARLKAQTLDLIEALEAARRKVPLAETALAEARAVEHEAQRTVTKFEEFVAEQEAEARAAETARADAEIEEVSEAAFGIRAAAARDG